jgi:hypothetical protein
LDNSEPLALFAMADERATGSIEEPS